MAIDDLPVHGQTDVSTQMSRSGQFRGNATRRLSRMPGTSEVIPFGTPGEMPVAPIGRLAMQIPDIF
ncbi:hypothetical protein [Burkholderia anthina]|uniref:hypothetical protein n=1 Tax=Burkholderia anthina TaxID=179879 RepID=UPI0037C097DA